MSRRGLAVIAFAVVVAPESIHAFAADPPSASPAVAPAAASEHEELVFTGPGRPLRAPWELRLQHFLDAHADERGRPDPGVSARALEFRQDLSNARREPAGPLTDNQSVRGSAWVDMGPWMIDLRNGSYWSGRVNSIAIDPTPPNGTLYLASGNGGVWKSTSAGDAWVPLTDFQDSTRTSRVYLDPEDPRIVYVATGDSETTMMPTYLGFGVLRSKDGGTTWEKLGATHFGEFTISHVVLDPTHTEDPLEHRILHVSHAGGVSYSLDGGKSWSFAEYQVGGAWQKMDCRASDLVMDPLSPSTLYAACYFSGLYKSTDGGRHYVPLNDEGNNIPRSGFGRAELAIAVDRSGPSPKTVVFASFEDLVTDSHGAELKGLYRSNNGGAYWRRLTGHPWQFADGTFVTANASETENNDTRANANLVADWILQRKVVGGEIGSASDVDWFRLRAVSDYVGIEILAWRANATPRLVPNLRFFDDQGNEVSSRLYALNDSSQKDWRAGFPAVSGRDYYVEVTGVSGSTGRYQLSAIGTPLSCQCGYDQVISPNPDNPQVVFLGMVHLFRSTDGGETFNDVTGHGLGANYIHDDQHEVVFDPSDPSGQTIWVGTDGGIYRSSNLGDFWSPRNPVGLSTAMIVRKLAQHPTDRNVMVMGLQDNGTVRFDGSRWLYEGDADGGFAAVVDGATWYQSSQESSFRRHSAGKKSSWTAGLARDFCPFIAPLVNDGNQRDVLLTCGSHKIAEPSTYAFNVYRTTNSTTPEWTAQNALDFDAPIEALAIAPSESRTYYAGTGNGKVYGTRDTGASWTELTAGWAQRPNVWVADIAVHPTQPDTIYVAYPGGQSGWHVARKAGWSATWEDVTPRDSKGTPMSTPAYSLAIDPQYPSTLFVGTENGIFRSIDAGANWTDFSNNLPSVAVNDLVIEPAAGEGGVMRAATWGRGVWELAPGNTLCQDAIPIGEGSYTGSTTKAGAKGSAKCGLSEKSPDVYYLYTAGCDGTATLDTCGSGFDTVLSVHDACPATSGNQVSKGCNDNCASCGNGSCLSLDVRKGNTYIVRVSGAGALANSGPFTLNIACRVPNDACTAAQYVSNTSVAPGSTRGATADGTPACGGIPQTGTGVWFRTVGTGTTMTASLCGFDVPRWDTRLSVYCGDCGSLSCVLSNDDASGCAPLSEVSWCAKAGTVYYLLVHGKDAAENQFQLYLHDNQASCATIATCGCANATCEQRFVTTGESGDNGNSGTDASATCASSNSDVWYEYRPGYNGFAALDTCAPGGTLSDSVLSVLAGCSDELACNDDRAGGGRCSETAVPVAAGVPRTVRVAGYGATPAGTFTLGIAESVAALALPRPGLYVVDGAWASAGSLFRLDPLLRSATLVGPLGSPPLASLTALAYAPNLGLLYGIDNDRFNPQLVTIDPASGTPSVVRASPFSGVNGLAWDPSRLLLFGAQSSSGNLVTINPASGEGRTIGAIGFPNIAALAFDPATRRLYGADNTYDALVAIDPLTGAGTLIGYFGAGYDDVQGLALDTETGTLYGVQLQSDGGGTLFVVDRSSGAAVQVRGTYANLGPRDMTYVAGLPDATVSRPYKATIPVGGGRPPLTFRSYGNLPRGLGGDSEGSIQGVPEIIVDADVVVDLVDTGGSQLNGAVAPLRVRPANDACPNALPAYEGDTPFLTQNAATDGPAEPLCEGYGDSQVGADVWFCHAALATGTLTADTCTSTYDTKLAAYEGCGCPSSAAALACNDDACATQSRISFAVVAGRQYLLRVGGYDERRGTGVLRLANDGVRGGACCTGSTCTYKTWPMCAEAHGTFLGEGTTCETTDADGDQLPDACDLCPADPYKTTPGACGCGHPDRDTDGDGLADCVDDDLDGDGVPNAEDLDPGDPGTCGDADRDGCDDCSARRGTDRANDGPDADADGICATGDCNDADASLWFLPVTSNLRFAPGSREQLQWDADPGARSATYTLYREPDPLGPRTVYDCFRTNLRETTTYDEQRPATGHVYFYLAAGRNGCGSGGIGSASDGSVRRPGACP